MQVLPTPHTNYKHTHTHTHPRVAALPPSHKVPVFSQSTSFTHLTHIMSAPIRTLLNQHSTASAGSTPLGAARKRSHRSLHAHNLSTTTRRSRDHTPRQQPADTIHSLFTNTIAPKIQCRERGVPLQRACNSCAPDFSKIIAVKIQCRERCVVGAQPLQQLVVHPRLPRGSSCGDCRGRAQVI